MKKLTLAKETLSALDAQDLGQVAGGQKISYPKNCLTAGQYNWCIESVHNYCALTEYCHK